MNTVAKSSRLIKATPFFYGWVVLVAGTVGIIMTSPGQTFAISAFIDDFIRDLAISRANISLLYGLGTLSAALLMPRVGILFDRYGPRTMVIATGACLGLVCIGMSRVQGVVTIFLGFLGLRFLGQGVLQMTSTNAIVLWFIRRRGLAMGLAGLGLAAGFAIFPDLIRRLASTFGWRGAWVALGLLVWGIVLPVGWLFFRDRPEEYGLLPDGDRKPLDQAGPGVSIEENWTLPEARRTGVFWIFAAAVATIAMVLTGLQFHQFSLFEQRGLGPETAIDAFRMVALFSAVGTFVIGWLLDHFSARNLLTAAMVCLASVMLLAQVMTTPGQALIYGTLMGVTSGFFRAMDTVVWAKYFGRAYLGAIRGATLMGVVAGTALGPYPLGLSSDHLGSYSPALTGLLVLPVGIGIASFFVKRPERRNAR